ncbi:N-acetyltransferase family 8 member 2 [Phytophthora citrophthora]|uniref:N-acetyltransferase family 8 member 2 n=1 Tax=Phytophthora citrophthora TaxID=4793 RepID=A0AAD9G112_9STRA|nr:N-acetyltransferase family 8 member 2 [Phytophthora citrophthora]
MGISDAGDIVIRQFRAEDLPQVLEIFKAGMESYAAFRAMPKESEAYLQESLSTDLSDIVGTYITPGGNFWVATSKTDPTEVVGMVGLEPKDNKEGELRRLSVKHTHRRFGVGRKLIAALEHWAKDTGFTKVWLTTAGVMDKARAFYPSVGYKQTDIILVSEDPHFEVYKFEKLLEMETTIHNSADIVVRQFREKDLEQVVTLFKNGMMHYPAHRMVAEVLEQHMAEAIRDLNGIEATYIKHGGNFWVATPRSDSNEVVGMVALEAQDDNVGELRRMSVKESYRRHGVGRLLIKELESWAQINGYRKIWLGTGVVMDKARAFYSSLGYTQTQTVIINDDPLIEGVLLEKELDNARE